jgi:hypothetical protein
VDYLLLRLRSLVDAIDRRVDEWWGGSLPEDEAIDPLTRQMEREVLEKLAELDSGAWHGGGE